MVSAFHVPVRPEAIGCRFGSRTSCHQQLQCALPLYKGSRAITPAGLPVWTTLLMRALTLELGTHISWHVVWEETVGGEKL